MDLHLPWLIFILIPDRIDMRLECMHDVHSHQHSIFHRVEQSLALSVKLQSAAEVLDDASDTLQFPNVLHDPDDGIQVAYAHEAQDGSWNVEDQGQQ